MTAIYLTNADILATLKKAQPSAVDDQQMRIVDVGKYNIGIGVVHRFGKAKQSAILHDQVTEVYHILDGSGTLVTGGTLTEAQRSAPDSAVVTLLTGPSTEGSALQNGESRRVAAGDVVIIPPGVGHWFSAIDDHINYLIVRVDGDKVLPAPYPATK